jgi:hypothetical protein
MKTRAGELLGGVGHRGGKKGDPIPRQGWERRCAVRHRETEVSGKREVVEARNERI